MGGLMLELQERNRIEAALTLMNAEELTPEEEKSLIMELYPDYWWGEESLEECLESFFNEIDGTPCKILNKDDEIMVEYHGHVFQVIQDGWRLDSEFIELNLRHAAAQAIMNELPITGIISLSSGDGCWCINGYREFTPGSFENDITCILLWIEKHYAQETL